MNSFIKHKGSCHFGAVAFEVEAEDNLSTYTFDTHEAKHLFCKICGIESFYIPRSNPDGVSVNARCLDDSTIESINIHSFDGKNDWEESAKDVAHLSNEKS